MREVFEKTRPTVDAAGESYVGFCTEQEMDALVRQTGFTELDHHPIKRLNETHFRGRSDGLRLSPVERLLAATREA